MNELRELSGKKGLNKEKLEEFLQIQRDALDGEGEVGIKSRQIKKVLLKQTQMDLAALKVPLNRFWKKI